jgi:hypothetical protein
MIRNGESESLNPIAVADATVIRPGGLAEQSLIHGRFEAWCVRDGVELWREAFDNVVTTVGKNHMLDNYLAGSAFTQVGPFLGLISSVGYAAGPVAADTMTSHAGWAEAGNGTNYPLWSTPASNARATAAWAAATAGAKALSAALAFVIATTGGTVKGAFMVLGSGAVATNNSTAGTLFSAGTFTGSDKIVSVGDTLNVSWNLSL